MAGLPFWIRSILIILKNTHSFSGLQEACNLSSLNFHLIFGFAFRYLKTPTIINTGFVDGAFWMDCPRPMPLTLNVFFASILRLPFQGDFKTKRMTKNLKLSLFDITPRPPAPLSPTPAAGIPFLLMTIESGFTGCVSLLPFPLLHTMPRASPGDCVSPRVGCVLSGMKSSLYLVCAYQLVKSVQHTGIPREEKERSEQ